MGGAHGRKRRWIMKNFIQRSFRRELLVSFLAVSVLPLIVCCVFLIQMFKVKVGRDFEKKNMELAGAVEQQLMTLFDAYHDAAKKLCTDPLVAEALEKESFGKKNEVYRSLYGATAACREMAGFHLYNADGSCLYSTGNRTYGQTLPVYWGILREAHAHPNDLIIRSDLEIGGDEVLRFARAVTGNSEECSGYFVVTMTAEHFAKALSGTYSGQDGICILNGFLETVYSVGTASGETVGDVLRSRFLQGESLTEVWNNNSIYVSKLGNTGLYSVLIRPHVFTSDTTRSMYTVLLFMAAGSFLLSVGVAIGISSFLSKPIHVLHDAMDEVQEGNLDTHVDMERQDEFGELAENFNIMTKRISSYMEERVRREKELNETQIAMMQSQLNPHFLYNTLDTMKWVAKANHIPEIATLAAKLAKILRTSISSAQFITLQEEMTLVESYAKIQKIRFNGKFDFRYEIAPETEEILVPKLIVQPIVENAVIHGLADADEGHIFVRAYLERKELVIEVSDDGCGISDEVIRRLGNRDKEQKNGHIGFYNVDTIIRLHYGKDYGLRAERLAAGGTKVTIRIPVNGYGQPDPGMENRS